MLKSIDVKNLAEAAAYDGFLNTDGDERFHTGNTLESATIGLEKFGTDLGGVPVERRTDKGSTRAIVKHEGFLYTICLNGHVSRKAA